MVSVSALAEPLAHIVRLVDNGLKFCKQGLKYKYGHHDFLLTSVFEMDETKKTLK